jgi:hypothetical protein
MSLKTAKSRAEPVEAEASSARGKQQEQAQYRRQQEPWPIVPGRTYAVTIKDHAKQTERWVKVMAVSKSVVTECATGDTWHWPAPGLTFKWNSRIESKDDDNDDDADDEVPESGEAKGTMQSNKYVLRHQDVFALPQIIDYFALHGPSGWSIAFIKHMTSTSKTSRGRS